MIWALGREAEGRSITAFSCANEAEGDAGGLFGYAQDFYSFSPGFGSTKLLFYSASAANLSARLGLGLPRQEGLQLVKLSARGLISREFILYKSSNKLQNQ